MARQWAILFSNQITLICNKAYIKHGLHNFPKIVLLCLHMSSTLRYLHLTINKFTLKCINCAIQPAVEGVCQIFLSVPRSPQKAKGWETLTQIFLHVTKSRRVFRSANQLISDIFFVIKLETNPALSLISELRNSRQKI